MLRDVFDKLRRKGESAFMPYQTAGYPTLAESLANLRTLAECGADLLELGLPFSDPMADGPAIQQSSQTALANGTTSRDVLAALKDAAPPRPVVLMSYLNPLLTYEREALFKEMRAAGVEGLIVPDLPLEESKEWLEPARRRGVSLVFMVAPTSTDERIRLTAEMTDGFIYAAALRGTTGARRELAADLPDFLRRIRTITDKPVVAGFGISTPEHVRSLRGLADGAIVASRIIDAMRLGEDWAALARSLKDATRAGGH